MASTDKVCPVCQSPLTEQENQFGFCSIECAEKHRDKVWRLSVDLRISRLCAQGLSTRRGKALKRRNRILGELRLLGNEWATQQDGNTRTLVETEEQKCQREWVKADSAVEKLSDAYATALKRCQELEFELESKTKVLEG